MPMLSQQELRDRAFAFAKEWEGEERERAEAQTFWNEFFNIFGITRRRIASFEEPVRNLGNNRGSIDLFWKGTLIVEHKSKGRDLEKAYGQALDYFPGIREQDLPQYVLVSDFERFRLYDLEADEYHDFTLSELPKKMHLFGFISGFQKRLYHDEDPVNIKVAEKMGELHDELSNSGYKGHNLERFLVRLVYTLFSDDTGIFPKDHFEYFIENRTNPNGADTGAILATIFQVLNTDPKDRQSTLDEELTQFPYVNGSLFSEALPIPSFTAKMRKILLDCCTFDWSKVSPAIFGSMFQTVMDEQGDRRRNLGAHYISEKNILKVVRGLFLDDLWEEFEKVKQNAVKLEQFHNRISHLKFFDPACGCGNFLIITYRELRSLEIEILKQKRALNPQQGYQMVTDVSQISKLDVDSLYGIEYEEFPARIAEVAIWLTDHQMNMQLSSEFGLNLTRLPLKKAANIHHGNALRMDWAKFVPKVVNDTFVYILGNPPFIGKHLRSAEQNEDMDIVCEPLGNYGVLDYVTAWYVKAADYIRDTYIIVAFVSTNSITQGEQVGVLWTWLLSQGIKIHFAHRTFRWSNEARGKAAVYCVVIGFGLQEASKKRIYDYENPDAEPMEVTATNINPYLIDYQDVIISSRNKPLSPVPFIIFGSKPTDGGFLLINNNEKEQFLELEPEAEKFIKPLISADEFLNGEKRWCLWLVDVNPSEVRNLPEVMKRINAVRDFRMTSKKAQTVELAETPYLFAEIRQPKSDYVLIPIHSSENRKYIPMAFFNKNSIVNNSCAMVPNATLYHFGVLTSLMHMAWVRQVCGRLESRYRYSNKIVYNNFPWAENVLDEQKEKVANAAQSVLDARARFPDSSLADLYDPSTMPKALVDAHRKLDEAVDRCYRPQPFNSELERLEFLFALYRKYTEPLTLAVEKTAKKTRKSAKNK